MQEESQADRAKGAVRDFALRGVGRVGTHLQAWRTHLSLENFIHFQRTAMVISIFVCLFVFPLELGGSQLSYSLHSYISLVLCNKLFSI